MVYRDYKTSPRIGHENVPARQASLPARKYTSNVHYIHPEDKSRISISLQSL